MKRLIYLLFLPLNACATVPAPDAGVAKRIGQAIEESGWRACDVAKYKVVGDDIMMATLRYAEQSQATSRVGPLSGLSYLAKCATGEIYWVEIPDSADYPSLAMPCDNRWTAFHGGGCSWNFGH